MTAAVARRPPRPGPRRLRTGRTTRRRAAAGTGRLGGLAGDRQRSHGAAVEPTGRRDHPSAPGQPRQLEGSLVGRGPVVAQEDPCTAAERVGNRSSRSDRRSAGILIARLEVCAEPRHLSRHRGHDRRVRVAEGGDGDAADEVEVPAVALVGHPGPGTGQARSAGCRSCRASVRQRTSSGVGWVVAGPRRRARQVLVGQDHRADPSAVKTSSSRLCGTRPSITCARSTPPRTARRQASIFGTIPRPGREQRLELPGTDLGDQLRGPASRRTGPPHR